MRGVQQHQPRYSLRIEQNTNHLRDVVVVQQRRSCPHGIVAEVVAPVHQPLQLRQPPVLGGRQQPPLPATAASITVCMLVTSVKQHK